MRYLFAAFLIVGIFIIPWIATTFPDVSIELANTLERIGDQVAAVLFSHNPVTVNEIKTNYANSSIPGAKKVRILIVPGHEPRYGGAEHGTLKERQLNVELADNLVNLLRQNNHYEVWTTRNNTEWTPEFTNYFKSGADDIHAWERAHRDEVKSLTQVGSYAPIVPTVYHNTVPAGVATRLYGIDKWVNENNMDIVVHIHFNDYPRSNSQVPGRYTGFTIYVPEKQYYNSEITKVLADTVFKRLKKYNPVSNLQGEKEGIVEDSDLIAIGPFNSVDAASMLIEYSYIYEPQLQDPDIRHSFLKEAAYETYLGLTDFFDATNAAQLSRSFDTLMLPHRFDQSITGKNDAPSDVFALQTALILEGYYPPQGESFTDCPRTGKFGTCTRKSLKAFQANHNISGELDTVGDKTREQLNQLYGPATL